MGRTIVWTSITVLFFALFQAAILSNLTFLPIVPDLVLLTITFVSFMNSSLTGVSCGFISGLFLDFLSSAPIGLNAFTKTLTGFIAGKFSGSFNMNRIGIPALMGFAATVLKAFSVFILSLFFGSGIHTYSLTGTSLWLEIAANMICAPIVFAILGAFPSLFSGKSRPGE
jgi:rod shape-determining protein MreD